MNRMFRHLVVFFLFWVGAWSVYGENLIREWTHVKGSKIEARFSSMRNRMVTLVTEKGRKVQLPITQLSAGDIEYLRVSGVVEESALPRPYTPKLLQVVQEDGTFPAEFLSSYLAASKGPDRWTLDGFEHVILPLRGEAVGTLVKEHQPAFLMEVTLSRYETKNRTITEYEQTGGRNPDGTPKLRRVEIPRKVWSWKHEATLHRFDGYQWKEIAKDRFPVDLVEEGAGVTKHSDSSLGTRAGTEATPAGEWLLSKLIWVNPLSGRVQGEQRLVDVHLRNDSLFPLIATHFKVDWSKPNEPAEQWTDAVVLLPGKQFQHQLLRKLTDENIGRSDRFRRPKVQVSGVRLATTKK